VQKPLGLSTKIIPPENRAESQNVFKAWMPLVPTTSLLVGVSHSAERRLAQPSSRELDAVGNALGTTLVLNMLAV